MDLIVITGPTASGKTSYAVKYAKEHNGEIINADSMQVYKYMDIGTAKPTMEEREGIPHFLLDVCDPDVNFSVATYCEMAHKCIKDVVSRGKLPILVGGTGLYIDSVVNNITFSDIPKDEEFCELLYKQALENGNEYIYKKLQIIDRQAADKIELNDTRRIVRALEVYHTTGKTITWHKQNSRKNPSLYNAQIYAFDFERSILYDRINRRVDEMIKKGLVEEVENLIKIGVTIDCTSMQGIGYKEILMYLDGLISFDSAVEMIKQASRRYAKRQLTWFRANKKINWINPEVLLV